MNKFQKQLLEWSQKFRSQMGSCAHQGVRNVSFSESFAYILNELSL